MPLSQTNPYDFPPAEPNVTWDSVHEAISTLKFPVAVELHQRISAVTQAKAPGPFCEALGALEAYLDALDDAELLSFERQILIKDYVMRGWRAWRESFTREVTKGWA